MFSLPLFFVALGREACLLIQRANLLFYIAIRVLTFFNMRAARHNVNLSQYLTAVHHAAVT
jgi:hypothetical protein